MSRKPGLRAAPLRVVPPRLAQDALTPLDALHYYWRRVEPSDRLRFLTEMLTPNERRTLAFGFDDEENPDARV